MRDAVANLPTGRPVRRPLRLPVGLKWRLGRACERIMSKVCVVLIEAVSRIRALRYVPRGILIPAERYVIARFGPDLFDEYYYLDRNADVRLAGMDPLKHYLKHGWRECRAPNASFDDGFYRAEAGLESERPVSALAHFLSIGLRRGIAPARDVDLVTWRRHNPEVDIARFDPYSHFLRKQKTRSSTGPPAAEISFARLARLTRKQTVPPLVDIVMPVYLGQAETLSAIRHVLEAEVRTGFELILVDDATLDSDLAADLEFLEACGLVTLLVHHQNQGFVRSINRGMAQSADRDVVWLNSDTEVYDGWLDRLRDAAYKMPKVATVTPLSNNATLCSYPRMDKNNAGELEIPWRELDRIAGQVNNERIVYSPTAVGFCTYIRRDAIDRIGILDVERFGYGYGEENDFSRRAIKAGWNNLIATDVVVRHFGAVSFGSGRAKRVEAALAIMNRRYPDYQSAVHRFLSEDPLHEARLALDHARLERLKTKGRRNVLIVSHSLGGGTHQHVSDEIARLRDGGASVFILTGGIGGKKTCRLSHADAGPLPAFEKLEITSDRLWSTLACLDLDEVKIHHLIDFHVDASALFRERLQALGVAYSFELHDYFAVCPRVNMADLGGMYCGEPGEAGCRACLLRRGSVAGRPNVTEWRARYGAFLAAASEVVVPDRDVADRLRKYFPKLTNVATIPHEEPVRVLEMESDKRQPGPLRIAVIGAIGPIKGVDILFATAMRAQRFSDGLKFTVIGYTHNDRVARACGISVTGAYDNSEVDLLIEQSDPDVIWVPSIWPETYCYTLSIALRSGRPVAGFEIGAVATRLRDFGRGHLIPLEDAARPERLIEALRLAAKDRAEKSTEAA